MVLLSGSQQCLDSLAASVLTTKEQSDLAGHQCVSVVLERLQNGRDTGMLQHPGSLAGNRDGDGVSVLCGDRDVVFPCPCPCPCCCRLSCKWCTTAKEAHHAVSLTVLTSTCPVERSDRATSIELRHGRRQQDSEKESASCSLHASSQAGCGRQLAERNTNCHYGEEGQPQPPRQACGCQHSARRRHQQHRIAPEMTSAPPANTSEDHQSHSRWDERSSNKALGRESRYKTVDLNSVLADTTENQLSASSQRKKRPSNRIPGRDSRDKGQTQHPCTCEVKARERTQTRQPCIYEQPETDRDKKWDKKINMCCKRMDPSEPYMETQGHPSRHQTRKHKHGGRVKQKALSASTHQTDLVVCPPKLQQECTAEPYLRREEPSEDSDKPASSHHQWQTSTTEEQKSPPGLQQDCSAAAPNPRRAEPSPGKHRDKPASSSHPEQCCSPSRERNPCQLTAAWLSQLWAEDQSAAQNGTPPGDQSLQRVQLRCMAECSLWRAEPSVAKDRDQLVGSSQQQCPSVYPSRQGGPEASPEQDHSLHCPVPPPSAPTSTPICPHHAYSHPHPHVHLQPHAHPHPHTCWRSVPGVCPYCRNELPLLSDVLEPLSSVLNGGGVVTSPATHGGAGGLYRMDPTLMPGVYYQPPLEYQLVAQGAGGGGSGMMTTDVPMMVMRPFTPGRTVPPECYRSYQMAEEQSTRRDQQSPTPTTTNWDDTCVDTAMLAPASWENRPTPASWENRPAPASWENRPAPASWENRPAPASWENRPAPASWENRPAPASWENRPAPASWENRPAPASWENRPAPASWDNRPAPASWDNRPAPASWDNRPAPASWDNRPAPASWENRPAPASWENRPAPASWENRPASASWENRTAPASWENRPAPAYWENRPTPASWVEPTRTRPTLPGKRIRIAPPGETTRDAHPWDRESNTAAPQWESTRPVLPWESTRPAPPWESTMDAPPWENIQVIPLGESTRAAPQAENNRIAQEESTRAVLQGESTRAAPQGESTRAAPQGESTMAAPQGESTRAAPQEESTTDYLNWCTPPNTPNTSSGLWVDMLSGPGNRRWSLQIPGRGGEESWQERSQSGSGCHGPPNPPNTPTTMSGTWADILPPHGTSMDRWSTGNVPTDPSALQSPVWLHYDRRQCNRSSVPCCLSVGRCVVAGPVSGECARTMHCHCPCRANRAHPFVYPPCMCLTYFLRKMGQRGVSLDHIVSPSSPPSPFTCGYRELPGQFLSLGNHMPPSERQRQQQQPPGGAFDGQAGQEGSSHVMKDAGDKVSTVSSSQPPDVISALVSEEADQESACQQPRCGGQPLAGSADASSRPKEPWLPGNNGKEESNAAHWSMQVQFDSHSCTSLVREVDSTEQVAGSACPAQSSQATGCPAQSSQATGCPAQSSQASRCPAQSSQATGCPAQSSQATGCPAQSSQAFGGNDKEKSSPGSQGTCVDLNRPPTRRTVKDEDVQKLCDRSIFYACLSLDCLPDKILGQDRPEDRSSSCGKGEGGRASLDSEDMEEKTMGSEDSRCVCVAVPKDETSVVVSTPGYASQPSSLSDPSPTQLMINVQLESTIDSASLLQQMKQEINKAVDGMVQLHEQQLEMRQVELTCHQYAQHEIRKLVQAFGNSGAAQQAVAIQEICSEDGMDAAAVSSAAEGRGQRSDQPPPCSRSVPPEALEKEGVRIIEWDRSSQHAELTAEQLAAQRELPASGSMTFLYAY